MITSTQWQDAENTVIIAVIADIPHFVPADPSNADYQKIITSGVEIAAYVAPPTPVPATISDRQFFQALAVQGVITQDEAKAAVKTGTVPAAMEALINALPAGQQFAAEMMISGATVFERNHPTTLAIAQAYGWTSAQMDTLWIAASQL